MITFNDEHWNGRGGRWKYYFPNAASIKCISSADWLDYLYGGKIIKCHGKLNDSGISRSATLTIEITDKNGKTDTGILTIYQDVFVINEPIITNKKGQIRASINNNILPDTGGTFNIKLVLTNINEDTITCIQGNASGSGVNWNKTISVNSTNVNKTFTFEFQALDIYGNIIKSNIVNGTLQAKQESIPDNPDSFEFNIINTSLETIQITSIDFNENYYFENFSIVSLKNKKWLNYRMTHCPEWITHELKSYSDYHIHTISTNRNNSSNLSDYIEFIQEESNKQIRFNVSFKKNNTNPSAQPLRCYYKSMPFDRDVTGPKSIEEIEQGTMESFSSSDTEKFVYILNENDHRGAWVAIPNTWKMTEWKELTMGTAFNECHEGDYNSIGRIFYSVGDYTVYMWRGTTRDNNTFQVTFNPK